MQDFAAINKDFHSKIKDKKNDYVSSPPVMSKDSTPSSLNSKVLGNHKESNSKSTKKTYVAAKSEVELTLTYLQSRLEKLSKQQPPVPEWVIFHIAEICIRLMDKYHNKIANILEQYILKQRSHYARCGLYVIDAICNDLFASSKQTNGTSKNISKKYPPQNKNICAFLSTIDEMLPRLFYSFIKREKHRIIQIEPIDESKIKLSTNDQLWIQKLLRRWYQHHFFRDNTIIYIIEKFQLSVPTRKENQKRRWKDDNEKQKPPKKKIKHQHYEPLNITLGNLPPEILLKIFEYLRPKQRCAMALTNSKFYQISKDKSLWKRISIKQHEKISLQKLINWTKQSWNQIDSISFPFCKQVNDESLELFSRNFHNLKHINFKGCSEISNIHHFIELISVNENRLKYLDISFLRFSRPANTELEIHSKLISQQISNCKNLTNLFVSNFNLISFDCLKDIFDSCKKLTLLDISCCPWLFGSLTKCKIQLSNTLKELHFMLPDQSLIQKKKHALKIIDCFPSLIKLSMNYNNFKYSQIIEKTINNVNITTLDSRIAILNSDLNLLKELIKKNYDEIYLHYYGKVSLFSKAIEIGNINIIEYLCSLSILIETSLEKNIFRMVNISKILHFPSGNPVSRIDKTSVNADNYEFLLRFLLQLINDEHHNNLNLYCGKLIDVYSSNNNFIRWVFFTAKQVCIFSAFLFFFRIN